MKRTPAARLFFLFLGVGFLGAVVHIGKRYPHLNNYAVEYGFDANLFGPNEGTFYLVYGLCALMAAFFLAMACRDVIFSAWRRIDWSSIRYTRLVFFLSLAVVISVSLIRLLVIQEAPMTDDEHAYLFSARILQSFRLFWEGYPDVLLPFLSNQFLVVGDLVYSQYYPGFPALLALGDGLGLVNLLNPILAGLGVLLTFFLSREINLSPAAAFVAALLISLSPSYLFTSAMLLPHTASLVCGALFLLLVIKAVRKNSLGLMSISGVVWGFFLFTRPLTAAVFGVAGALVAVGDGTTVKRRLKIIVLLAGIAFVFCGLFLLYNKFLTGEYFKTTYTAFAELHRTPLLNQFSLRQIFDGKWMELLVLPFLRMNVWAFGWAFSFCFIVFCPPGFSRKLGLGVVCGLWLSHLSWPNVGVNISGAAHYLEVLPFVSILTAAALVRLAGIKRKEISGFSLSFAVASAVIAVAVFFPWATNNLSHLALTNLAPYQVEPLARKPAIIFSTMVIETKEDGRNSAGHTTWTFFRRNNRPDLSDDILWLNDLGDQNAEAMRLFPRRHAYRLTRKTDPGSALTAYSLEEIERLERIP